MDETSHSLTDHQRNTVAGQLERIATNQLFERAQRMTRLLRYLVDAALAGRGEGVNQYVLAQDVFERGGDFDPATDAIVRVEVGRLRGKLREYYAGSGADDPVLILLPKRTYLPRIEFRDSAGSPRAGEPVLAVLAFDNMGHDPEQEYFADGLSEDLITDLSRISGLSVIARQSSFVYKGTPVDIRVAGAELGADFVIEGSVRRAGDRLRINAQLISVATGSHLWAERYDRDLTDIFAVQDEINDSILGALERVLRWQAPHGARPRGTLNLAAYECLLKALNEGHPRTPKTWKEARSNLARAIELDPGYALAHAHMALHLVKSWLFRWRTDRQSVTGQALAAAELAVALEPTLGAAHNSLAWARFWSGDPAGALEAGEHAYDLNPGDADALERFCMILCWTGAPERVLELVGRLESLNPNERYDFLAGVARFIEEEYARAAGLLETHIEHYPGFLPAHLFKAASLGQLGEEEAASAAAAEVRRISPGFVADPTDREIFRFPQDRDRFHAGLRVAGLL